MLNWLKSVIEKFLSNLAKANQESFGNERPDCCKLNRNDNEK